MRAMDAISADDVTRNLTTLGAQDQSSNNTLSPARAAKGGWMARARGMFKHAVAKRRVSRDVAHLSPRLLSDIGLNPTALNSSISDRLDQVIAERETMRRNSILRA